MKPVIAFIASRIADSSKPLADRAALARWARSTCWAPQIERLLLSIARDQSFSHAARN